ncbi:MAG: protein phosphatase [Cyanobium sp.]
MLLQSAQRRALRQAGVSGSTHVRDAPSPATPEAPPWQAALFAFAIGELVRQHRQSFAPLWTVESWAKLLIWLALSSGCATDQASLEGFASGLGPALTARMRRLFFERDLEDLNLRLMADPSEAQVLALPIDGQVPLPGPPELLEALERVGLTPRVGPPERWQHHGNLIALPWQEEIAPCA